MNKHSHTPKMKLELPLNRVFTRIEDPITESLDSESGILRL